MGHLPQGEMYALLLGRGGEARELTLHLWMLSYLQLKIILTAKWRILGWCILTLFKYKAKLSN